MQGRKSAHAMRIKFKHIQFKRGLFPPTSVSFGSNFQDNKTDNSSKRDVRLINRAQRDRVI